jgi:hypothetical protein
VAAWLAGPFLKTICQVNVAEFEAAKQVPDVLITESALGGQEVALAFKPRQQWPKAFKYFRLYRSPQSEDTLFMRLAVRIPTHESAWEEALPSFPLG